MAHRLEAALERRTRPPRAPNLVRDPRPDEVGTMVDWSSWYLPAPPAGKLERDATLSGLLAALRSLVVERGWGDVQVGSGAAFGWIESEPLVRVYPDVYLIEGSPPPAGAELWPLWLTGRRAPWLAVELVSASWGNDYEILPQKYAQLGARELVVFDADLAAGQAHSVRVPLQLFHREPDGVFLCVHSGDGPAWCDELEVWLQVSRSELGNGELRLSDDRAGREPVTGHPAPLADSAADPRPELDAQRRDLDEQRRDLDEQRRDLDEQRRRLERERQFAPPRG